MVTGCSSNSQQGGSGGVGTQNNPAPTLTSISPSSINAGSGPVTITLNGSNFVSTSLAQWNGTKLFTTYQNATTLAATINALHLASAGSASISVMNQAPGGGTSTAVAFTVKSAPASQITIIPVNANSLAWDRMNHVIYLSLPSADGSNGNSVVALNPETGALGTPVFVGTEPDHLSVSANSQYLYVGLDGASSVQRMTLPDLATDITIPLGSSSFSGSFYAMDLQAAPNADGTVAVVRYDPYDFPEEEGGLIIYDNGTARPNSLCGWNAEPEGCTGPIGNLYDSTQWNSDGTEMFMANNEDTRFDFYAVPVNSSGFGTVTDYPGLLPGTAGAFTFAPLIHYDPTTGYIYSDTGAVVNPSTGTLVGNLNASGLVTPVGSIGIVFVLSLVPSSTTNLEYTLEAFDINKLTPIASLAIFPSELPTHMIRWGTNGLAFTTASVSGITFTPGPVYVINGSFATNAGALDEK